MNVKAIVLYAFFALAVGQYCATAQKHQDEESKELISLPCFLENAPCSSEEQSYKGMYKNMCVYPLYKF